MGFSWTCMEFLFVFGTWVGGWLARRPILNLGFPTISQGAGAYTWYQWWLNNQDEKDQIVVTKYLHLILLLCGMFVKLKLLRIDVMIFLPLLWKMKKCDKNVFNANLKSIEIQNQTIKSNNILLPSLERPQSSIWASEVYGGRVSLGSASSSRFESPTPSDND